jgi:Zn-dependent protease
MMMDFDWQQIGYIASVWVLPVMLAVTFHEAAHGWVAWRLGDPTAHSLGRVTFNPLKHIDPFGTVILPALLLLGSGDMVLVAAAGPAANLLLALIAAGFMHALVFTQGDLRDWLGQNLVNAVWINCLLCVFNMLPMPPLDGGRVAVGLLPPALGIRLARLERVGIVILLLVVFLLPFLGSRLGLDLNIFWWLVGRPAEYLMNGVLTAFGIW